MALHPRHYQGEADYARVQAFLKARESWDNLPDYWHSGKSPLGLYLTMLEGEQSEHWLWEDRQGSVQAYTWLYPAQPVHTMPTVDKRGWRLLAHPKWRTAETVSAALHHAEAQLAARTDGPAAHNPLETVAYASDKWFASQLEAEGYTQHEAFEIYMKMSLASKIPPPNVNTTYVVREPQGERDIAQRAGAQRNSFGGEPEADAWSLEDVHQQLRFDQENGGFDLVAVSAEGVVAAYAHVMLDPITRHGEFDPVGARPAFRRQGLTRAILLTGLQAMQERGMHSAIVRTGVDNLAARCLYESVGYHIVDRLHRWVRVEV